jgi:subtilisin family serine protease
VRVPDLSCIYKLTFPPDRSVDSLVDELENSGDVSYAEPNHIFYLERIPNDPRFPEQWNLNQENDYDINAPEAWDIQVGNTAIKIGIFDTGIDFTHCDLPGVSPGQKVSGGWNFIDNNSNILD